MNSFFKTTALALLISVGAHAQNYTGEKLLSDYVNRDGVTSISLNHSISELMDNQLDLDDDKGQLDGEVKKMRLTILPAEGLAWAGEIEKKLRSQKFDEILSIVEDGKKAVTILARKNGKFLEDIQIMIVDREEGQTLIFSIYGELQWIKKQK